MTTRRLKGTPWTGRARRALTLVLLLLAGCGTEDFPGAPSGVSGVRDVPYVTTYNFGFEVGFTSVSGADGNLLIVSGGDLINMISAANITQRPATGVVSGRVFTSRGIAAADVVLAATDVRGRRLGDFFYNSLGGTPDFVQTRGTVASGGFTAFNVDPGEVFLTAVAGGRGAGRLTAFADEVSLGTVTVAPVVVPTIGVTGEITNEGGRAIGKADLGGADVELSIVGQRVSEASDCGDDLPTQDRVAAVSRPTLTAFRFCMPSEGLYWVKVSGGEKFVDTYQSFRSDRSRLTDLQTADITEFLTIQTAAGLRAAAEAAGVTWDPSKGVLAGQLRAENGSPRNGAYIQLTDDAGAPLASGNRGDASNGVIVYLDGAGLPVLNADQQPVGSGRFVILNIPIPSEETSRIVYLTIRVTETSTEGVPGRHFATLIAPVFRNAATFQLITVAAAPPPIEGEAVNFPYFSGPVSGRVMGEDGLAPVANGRITVLGVPLADLADEPRPPGTLPRTGSDPEVFPIAADGTFDVPYNANTASPLPLMQSSEYLVKVEGPGGVADRDYWPTYQRLRTGPATKDPDTRVMHAFTNDLVGVTRRAVAEYLAAVNTGLSPAAPIVQDPSRGLLIGTAVAKGTGLPTPGISVRLAPLDGITVTPAPTIVYFDFAGIPRRELRATTGDGRFLVLNAPVGSVSLEVTSPDDTGNTVADSRAGGVTVVRLGVNNAPPVTVDVSGSIAALVGDIPADGITLSVAGGDPMAMRTECPENTVERGGVCYQDPTVLENSKDKKPIPCGRTEVYGEFRIERDGFCVLNYTAGATFTVPIGSSRDVVMRTAGAGLMDTYTYGTRTTDRAVNGVSVGAVTPVAIEAVASSAGLTRAAGTGVIWGRTTVTGFGETDASGALVPRTCAGWTMFPNNDPAGCAALGMPGALVTGFFNADTYRDLAVVDTTPMGTGSGPGITVWLNTSDGSFVRSQRIGRRPDCRIGDADCGVEDGPEAVSVVDFTDDGLADLVVLNRISRSVSMLEGRGRGQFVFGGSLEVGTSAVDPNAMAVEDFNRDGNPDVFITDHTSGRLIALFGTGSGFRMGDPSDTVVGESPQAVISGFVDSDGVPDVVFVNERAIVVRTLGNNGFRGYTVPTGDAARFSAAAIGDLNFDGLNDVVVTDRAANTAWIFLNSASGLQTPTPVPTGNDPAAVALMDVHNDGALDLVVLNRGDGTILLRQGNGQGSFTSEQIVTVGGAPSFMALGDLTGDGAADVALSNPSVPLQRVIVLPQTAGPRAGVAVAATRADGFDVGTVVYLDSSGDAVPGAVATGPSGRFAIFNAPPGMVWLRMRSVGIGSRLVYVYPDSVVNTAFPVIVGSTSTIVMSGATVDAVVRPVGEVQIRFLGTARVTSSRPIELDPNGNASGGADYRVRVEANNDYVLRLSK
ncbi:MAG: FG-GAP repeat domain-containing protein [Nitrospirota bacterium]